jgi:hypothetical protein
VRAFSDIKFVGVCLWFHAFYTTDQSNINKIQQDATVCR